jgi:hypothetical protein
VEAEDDVVEEVEADTVDGSAVIRSIRVVPDESYTIPFISKLTQKKKKEKRGNVEARVQHRRISIQKLPPWLSFCNR